MANVVMQGITKSFDKTEVIHPINLEIKSGEFVVFVGPSGCGKSTLLRLVAGLENITTGQLVIDDICVNALPPAKRGVAMVFQSYALYPHMTVFDNMAFGLTIQREQRAEIERKVRHAAQTLQIEHLLDRKPKALSGGQCQRVAIGRAIVREPKVFLFDEPLSNLDATLRERMRVEIAKLHASLGATTIYVTHDQIEAMTLADKIVVLNKGQIEQVGTPLELYQYPRNRFVAGFIGSPTMNFIEGTLTEAGEEHVTVALAGNQKPIPVAVNAGQAKVNDPITMGVRPEHLSLSSTHGHIEGVVVVIEHLGNDVFAYLEVAGNTADNYFIVRLSPQERVQRGDVLRLNVSPSSSYLFNADGLAFEPVNRKVL